MKMKEKSFIFHLSLGLIFVRAKMKELMKASQTLIKSELKMKQNVLNIHIYTSPLSR